MWADVASHTGDRVRAKWLCQHASGCDGAEFDAVLDEYVSERSGLHMETMLRRLATGEPLQYVMGRWSFRRLDLMVDTRVLIPRPETEGLVDIALAHARRHDGSPPLQVVDMGTGSGAVGLSILDELPLGAATVWMTDASVDALDVARANAAGLGRPAAHARFTQGDWWSALPADMVSKVDIAVSNPPYIAADDPLVDDVVRQWEPHEALFAGNDGLGAIRTIAAEACRWLAPGGLLALEIGHLQGAQVRDILAHAGLHDVVVAQDAAGRDRYAYGVRAV